MFLDELCAEVRNWFVRQDGKGILRGEFTIQNGDIANLPVTFGQYYRILGSALNDGIHKRGQEILSDETFDGEIWLMRVPLDFIQLADEIENWNEENADAMNSPYTSESFGGYSYSKQTGGTTGNGGGVAYTWKNQFASRLSRYRRLMK